MHLEIVVIYIFTLFTNRARQSISSNESVTPENSYTERSLSMRRKQFASRKESSIGAMVMTNKFDDSDIRRRFRNYEI